MSAPIVPKEILDQHVAILGKTRSGKSSAMRLLVESLLKRKLPVCIVDPKGDWWGIKLAGDGKGPGFPVVIFGGEHADVPITEHVGADVAELFATGNRSMLIDLGGWTVGARTRFWIDFASALFKHTKGQRWLAVDEFHNFAPKGKVFDADAGKMLHWSNRLASEGLGKGLSLLFASQRPQKVHNDALTSAETLIAMRVLHPSDRAAVSDWIKGCGDSGGDNVLNSLANLTRGEGWVWSPEYKFGPTRVQFPLFTTYDSFRAQSVDDTKRLKGWADVDLAGITEKFAATIETRKANDPGLLKQRIKELEWKLAAVPSSAGKKPEVGLTEADRNLLTSLAETWRTTVDLLSHRSGVWIKNIEDVVAKMLREADAMHDHHAKQRGLFLEDLQRHRFAAILEKLSGAPAPSQHAARTGGSLPNTRIRQEDAPSRRAPATLPTGADTALPVGERAILTAAAQYPQGLTREQASILTGYKRSSRDTYIQRLVGRGYVEVVAGTIVITEGGMSALGDDFEPLPTGALLRDYWLDRLPQGEQAILGVVIAKYPDQVDVEDIDKATDYKRSSRDTYIQRLVARQLVTRGRGMVRASDELF